MKQPQLTSIERQLRSIIAAIHTVQRGHHDPHHRQRKPVRKNWIHEMVEEAVSGIKSSDFTIGQVAKSLARHRSTFAPATVRSHLEDMVASRKLKVIVRGRGRRATVFRKKEGVAAA